MKKEKNPDLRLFIPLIILIIYTGLVSGCSDFPTNPAKEPPPEPEVVIRHVQTEYIVVTETGSDLITNKINVLTFEILPQNIECKALEFCGRATLCGPPVEQEHVIHFRTDQAMDQNEGMTIHPNIVERIQSGSPITLFRIKYPTNEYAPFEGDQGKIQRLEIEDVWSIDADALRTPLCFHQEPG